MTTTTTLATITGIWIGASLTAAAAWIALHRLARRGCPCPDHNCR